MTMPLLLKIRIVLVLAVGAIGFGLAGSSLLEWDVYDGVRTIVFDAHPMRVMLVSVGLMLVVTALAVVIARPYGAELAPLALPAGLAVWSVTTGTFESLLFARPDWPARSVMFYHLLADVALWSSLVFMAQLLIRFALPTDKPTSQQATDKTPSSGATGKSLSSRMIGKPSKAGSVLDRPAVRAVLAIVVSSIVAVLLLRLLAQSGRIWLDDRHTVAAASVPQMAQALFAVALAFLLATLAAQQLLGGSLWVFLVVVPIVAGGGYIVAGMHSLPAAAASLVPGATVFAAILPVQYVGFGSLAVIAGYWYSIKIRRLRRR